jgi:hypothetical protein
MRYRALRDNVDHRGKFVKAGTVVEYGPDEPVSHHFESAEGTGAEPAPAPVTGAEGLATLAEPEDADGMNEEILSGYTRTQLKHIALTRYGQTLPSRATKAEMVSAILAMIKSQWQRQSYRCATRLCIVSAVKTP